MAVLLHAFHRVDGIAKSALLVAQGLVDKGHEVSLVHPTRSYDQSRLSEWHDLTPRVHAVPELSVHRAFPLRSIRGVAVAAARIRSLDADVIHVHQPAHAALTTLSSSAPTVLHLRGLPASPGRAQRAGIRRADHTIPVAEAVRDAWTRFGLDPARSTVVHNGVDLDHNRPAAEMARATSRRRLGIPDEAQVIGFCGRFSAAKGVFMLADAFESLRRDNPNAWLVMVGGTAVHAGERTRLEQQLGDDRVLLLDATDDVRPIIAGFDIGVVPSATEAFSNVVLELLASGLPVLGTTVGGIPEAVGPVLGKWLVPFGDTAGLAGSIADVLGHSDRPALSQLARERGEMFDFRDTVTRTIEILETAADR